jgi:putative metallohydrolase (TIGR04338 family)
MGFIAKPPPRDSQRGRLYQAENEVAAILRDELPKIGQMQAFVDEILRSPWLQGQFGTRMLAPITVVGGHGQRDATAHCFMSEISMPRALRSKFIVLHEVAHILTARFYGEDRFAAHGEHFATFLLMLVDHFLGAEDCQDLLQAFARWGVAHSYRE